MLYRIIKASMLAISLSMLATTLVVGIVHDVSASTPDWLGQAYWVYCQKGPFCHLVNVNGALINQCDGQEVITGVLNANGSSTNLMGKTFTVDGILSVAGSGGGLASVSRSTNFNGSVSLVNYTGMSSKSLTASSSLGDSFTRYASATQVVDLMTIGGRASSQSQGPISCRVYDYTTGQYF